MAPPQPEIAKFELKKEFEILLTSVDEVEYQIAPPVEGWSVNNEETEETVLL